MNLLSFEQLNADLTAYKNNFETSKLQQIESLLEQKQIAMLELKELSDFQEMQTKIESINAISLEIESIKKLTANEITPKPCYLFNGQIYEGRKQVTGRVANSKGYKFADGDKVKLSYQGIEDGQIYTVRHEEGKAPFVTNSENKPFSPSKLTEQFHVNALGKQLSINSKGMAGLSHPYWIKAE